MDTTLTSSTLESVLVFHSGYKTDESVYTCIGSNNITNIISSPEEDNVTLLVQGKEKRERGREGGRGNCIINSLFSFLLPTVPVEIVNSPVNTIHYAGGNITLSCNASGIPLPTFQWYKNNQLITPNERVYLTTSTHVSTLIYSLIESILVLNDIVLEDDDYYYCQATNEGAHTTVFNVISQSANLTVYRKYFIISIIIIN